MGRGKKGFFFHSSPFPLKNRVGITTGDPEGIGKLVAKKALTNLGPKKNFQFVIWTDSKAKTLKIPAFQALVFKSSKKAFESPFKENHVLQIKSSGGPGRLAGRSHKTLLKQRNFCSYYRSC